MVRWLRYVHIIFNFHIKFCYFQEPDRRFTYSQGFSTATVLPVDPDEVRRTELGTSRKEWRTPQGFVLPGPKTSRESNKHSKEPDFARLDELKKVNFTFLFSCRLWGTCQITVEINCINIFEELIFLTLYSLFFSHGRKTFFTQISWNQLLIGTFSEYIKFWF